MLYLGTSGFSYDDWLGTFYPAGMPKRDWLAFYSREFNTCEINSTYYVIPGLASIKAMVDKTPQNFLFSIKANQEMTHTRSDNSQVFEAFRAMLEPFRSSGKLGCVLAQFPYSFYFNRANRDYLEKFKEETGELPLVIEFRNAAWLKEEVFDWLNRKSIGFCCVDEPRLDNLIPPLARLTGNTAYVRFHGRNAAKWWQHQQAYERYDYTYTAEELAEWIPKIKSLNNKARNTFVYANNHFKAQAVSTIRQLRLLLD
jgi:uncharacterized protein YecE (DUF72 family)